jgi:UrcA family protein
MSGREPTRVVISTKNVDFADQQSVAKFDDRLRWAAFVACESPEPRSLATQSEDRACALQTWDAAVKRLDQPLLSQRHDSGVALAKNTVVSPGEANAATR